MQHNNFYKILILMTMLIYLTRQSTCHYSCQTCVSNLYIRCITCPNSSKLTVIEDPAKIQPAYRHSLYPNGLCTAQVPQGANTLGILLLIFSIVGILITQSHQAFYICSTFQTLGLFGLLQIAWIHPSSYILQAFQYFMPINLILSKSKNDDTHLLNFGFYRLDEYMVSSQDVGLIAIFAIDCILFAVIIGLFILTMMKKRQQKRNEMEDMQKNEFIPQNSNNLVALNSNNLLPQISTNNQLNQRVQNKNEQNFIYQTAYKTQKQQKANKNPLQMNKQQLSIDNKQQGKPSCLAKMKQLFKGIFLNCFIPRKMLHLIMYIFYFFVQQTILSIMVGAVFTISKLDVAIWIVYFIQVVTVLIISFYQYSLDSRQNKIKKQYELSEIIQKQIQHEKKQSALQAWIQNNQNQKKQHFQFGLSLFISRQCMFIVLIKKVVLPLGIVVPLNIQYMYFIFYLILFIIQGSFDSKSGRVPCLSRITLWKIFQMIVTTLILSFFFNQKGGSTSSSAATVNIILVISFVALLISLAVQFVFSFLGMFFGIKKIHNTHDLSTGQKNEGHIKLDNTEQTINNDMQKQEFQNVFQTVQLTRQVTPIYQTQQKKEEINKKVEIKQVQDYQNNHIDKNKLQKNNILFISTTPVKPQPKAQPKIQPKIQPKVQPKVQPKIVPKVQPVIEAKINTIDKDLVNNRQQSLQKKQDNLILLNQNQNKTIDTNREQETDKKNQSINEDNEIVQNDRELQNIVENDENQNKKKKKQKKRMRIMDPQLRKRYGMK